MLLAEAAGLSGLTGFLARTGVLFAAILIPAGFFLSSMGHEVTASNRWIVLLRGGVAVLALGVVTLGIGLLTV